MNLINVSNQLGIIFDYPEIPLTEMIGILWNTRQDKEKTEMYLEKAENYFKNWKLSKGQDYNFSSSSSDLLLPMEYVYFYFIFIYFFIFFNFIVFILI